MGTRYQSHQLSNGLFVSGRPEQPKEKAPPVTSSSAMPYTGGDIKKSGELGKMFDIPTDGSKSRKSGPSPNPNSRSGSFSGPATAPRAPFTSGNLSNPPQTVSKKSGSGPMNKHGEPLKRSSGPQSGPVLAATGLITSGPLNTSGGQRKVSGSLDGKSLGKAQSFAAHNPAVTTLAKDDEFSFRRSFPKTVLWLIVLIFVMGILAGSFILGAVHNAVFLVVVVALFFALVSFLAWNFFWGRRAIIEFISSYPNADLRTAENGQFVKVSGVVTCGNFPLETSFQGVPRCVYTSTRLFEYRGIGSKPANTKHRYFSWGIRSAERHVVDFYISDFQSGFRALVKTGNGAKVTPFVDDSFVVDVDPKDKEISPQFLRWLSLKNLSSDDRRMRLKEGYIKEGNIVSVMGTVQRNDNVLLIVPPSDPFATGWIWSKCIFPATLDGIILRNEDTSNVEVVPV